MRCLIATDFSNNHNRTIPLRPPLEYDEWCCVTALFDAQNIANNRHLAQPVTNSAAIQKIISLLKSNSNAAFCRAGFIPICSNHQWTLTPKPRMDTNFRSFRMIAICSVTALHGFSPPKATIVKSPESSI